MIYVRRTAIPGVLEVSEAHAGSEWLGTTGFDLLIPKKSDFNAEEASTGFYYYSYCVIRDGLDRELLDWCVPR